MKMVISKKYGISICHVLFADRVEETPKCDIVRYTRCNRSVPELREQCKETVSYTLVTELAGSPDEILAKFSPTFRYHIKRSERDNIKNNCYWSHDFHGGKNQSVLDEFHKTYDNFCDKSSQKELKKIFDKKRIKDYIENDCFMLSIAEFENGKVFHAYIHDDSNAVLWYSASDFRNENVDRNLASRANKGLHFYDILQFRSKGLTTYDWGNISSKNNEKPCGIDVFKSGFNGDYCEKYFYTHGKSLIGKIICKLI